MLYYFKQGKNAAEVQKEVCAVCDRMRQKWFVKFLGATDILTT